MRVRVSRGDLTLEVEDDGRGIEPERLEKSQTLRALRQRAERVGGQLRLDSEPGKGTRIRLTLGMAA